MIVPQSYLHLLQIAGQVSVWDLQSSLQHTATTPDNCNYYMQHKHNWSPHDCDNINWISLRLALCQFSQMECQWLQNSYTIVYPYLAPKTCTSQAWTLPPQYAVKNQKHSGTSWNASTPPDRLLYNKCKHNFNTCTRPTTLTHTYSNCCGKD